MPFRLKESLPTTWLTTGGKTGVKWKESSTWAALKDRRVILYPNLGIYDNWKAKEKYIHFKIPISDLLYLSATEDSDWRGWIWRTFF